MQEMFYSLHGEGLNAGRPAVFWRFSECEFWSGGERDRATAACNFCEADFVGSMETTAADAKIPVRWQRQAYCLRHPRWRLSLQTHNLVGIS
ncbi:hypothetical protein [Methylosinus sporium]|uniref:hypothetical protein n=1 Tax=Methylosinus sporium TaxID=428 RepID=UPI00383A90BE